jgi:hypothetical protein
MKTKLLSLVAVLLIVGGNIASSQPVAKRETVTLTGKLEPTAFDASGKATSASIYDEEWGLVLISNVGEGKTLADRVDGPHVLVTGQIQRRKTAASGFQNVLEVTAYKVLSPEQKEITPVGGSALPPRETIPSEVVYGANGAAISVIGNYDVGLDETSFQKPESVAKALRGFVIKNRDLYKLKAGDDVKFAVRAVRLLADGTGVAEVDQYMGALRVLDSEVTAALTASGTLESINGTPFVNRNPGAQTLLGIDRAITVLVKDARDAGPAATAALGEMGAFKPNTPNKWRRGDGATIEAGWSVRHNAVVWRAFLPRAVIWIDDANGIIVRRESQEDAWGDSEVRRANVRHRDWPRGDDGRATSLNEIPGFPPVTLVEQLRVGGDEWWGTCFWHLKRQPFGFPHGIARIQDEIGGEQEVSQPCSSGIRPSFTRSNGDALREQGAFYIASQMRHFIDQNVWSQAAPNRDSNIDFHMDDAGVPTAVFNNFFTSIRANPSFGQQDVLMHEFGHYVVWTYDDVSGNCDPGRDEGDSIDETLANVFGQLFAADDPEIDPTYGALEGFALNNGPAPHTNTSSSITQNITCATANNPADGQAFQQAIWELMFNRDCTSDTCTSASGVGNTIWVGESQEAVITHVGAALGRALQVLGQNITHSQIRAQIILKIRTDSGNATANRARAVFEHHGI